METGRIKRFLADGASGYAADTEEKKARREHRSLLDMLLMEDPHYAALYNRVAEKLDRAQQAVDAALIDIDERLEASEQNLQNMRDNAGELEDGTKVFRSSVDGSVYTEDGRRLSDEEAQNVDIPDDASSWEDYQRQKEERDLALRQREEIERYQREVLDPIKERMRDPDNVFTKDELEEIDKNIEASLPDTLTKDHQGFDPSISEVEANSSTSAAHDMVEETNLEVPEMNKAFKTASLDIPDLDSAPVPAPEQVVTRALS
ncbi:MAG: hypothetical protein JAZ11_00140 [Candidatus Thiodiazotropha lotti]|nr:hypothetical protein [Candidatus Thiodiazotropha lotti]